MRRVGALALALLGAPAVPAGSTARPSITLTMSSWGRPYLSWTVQPDGRLSLSRYAGATPPPLPAPMPLTARRTAAGRGRYAWVAARLAALRRHAGTNLPCAQAITDAPYGELIWGDGARLQFYTQCSQPRTRAAVDGVLAVSERIEAWVDKREPPRLPHGHDDQTHR